MVRKGMKVCQIVTYMITLGVVTPVGITVGIVLTLNVDAQSGEDLEGTAWGSSDNGPIYHFLFRCRHPVADRRTVSGPGRGHPALRDVLRGPGQGEAREPPHERDQGLGHHGRRVRPHGGPRGVRSVGRVTNLEIRESK